MPDTAPPAPAVLAGPVCAACDSTAVVQWLRRPTDTETAEAVRMEQERRDRIVLLADPQLPAPAFPPPPTCEDLVRTVYACASHAITLDAAALIHAGTCTAPNRADLPGCDCTPEQPPRDLIDEPSGPELPAHWVAGGV
jgi:hypothetical protein